MAGNRGLAVERYEMRAGALSMDVLSVGCAISRLEVPDRCGRLANVVLGHADLADYAAGRREYLGAVVGRVGNRIAEGRFVLDGREHRLAVNDGPHHLHGGARGFDRQPWRLIEQDSDGAKASLRLRLVSPDGDEGYPGELTATVTYTLSGDGELRFDYEATTDAPTLVNLTQHSYFNLGGEGSGDVLDHELAIDADAYCAVDGTLIPTGELRPVDGTPFDFRRARPIGVALRGRDRQLELAGGFDHCMVLSHWAAAHRAVRHACTLSDAASGRRLRVATDQPGVQFYSGNFLDGTARGPTGVAYSRHAGLCLETQRFPDAPHHAGFPSIVLRPGERYTATTVLRFDVLP